jgi:hypothetical protein
MSNQQQATAAATPVPADQGAFLDEVISIKQFLSELNKAQEENMETWTLMKRQPYAESIDGVILDPFGRRPIGGG